MKVLYISPYLGFSGYSTAARGYVAALHKVGVDIILRNVKYDEGQEHQLEGWERELFTRAPDDVDIIIQHLTPNEMAVCEGTGSAKYIGMLATETDSISSVWAESLNRMDAIITFCNMSAEAIKKGGCTKPIHVMPHTFNMERYQEVLEPILDISGEVPADDAEKPVVFYNISQISTKKGIDTLLRAYAGAFRDGENTLLILKGYFNQMTRTSEEEEIMKFVESVKDGMRLPAPPPIVVISQILDDNKIARIHATGDVYVNASCGEGWGIPLFDAAAYGNGIVSTLWGGPAAFLKEDGIYEVGHSIEPVYGMRHPIPYMFTSAEQWAEPSVNSMIKQMRMAYQDKREDKLRTITGLERFDYSVVGPEFKQLLESILQE
jgi:glycosyltransferase involved in cell wall biosynthesis